MSYHNISKNGVDSAEPLFDDAPPAKQFTLSTVVQYRGRSITIASVGYTADEFCDLLDRRFGKEHAAPASSPATDAPPVCPVHSRKMKLMNFTDKQGRTHMCTAKVGDGWCDQRA